VTYKIRVLYAEDNPFDAELIQSKFRRKAPHFDLIIVPTGTECLQQLQVSRFDILLLDHQLPDIDGLRLITEIRKMNIDVPIVLFTGAGDETIVVNALKRGASDYIRKSIDSFSALPSVLKNIVTLHKQKTKLGISAMNEPRKILFIADNFAEVKLTLEYLSTAAPQNTIQVAASGEEALQMLQNDSFDLVILDLQISQMNGLDLLNQARHHGFRKPFIVLTGKGDEETAVAALKLGAYDLIFKRQNYLEELVPVIQSVFAHHMLIEKTEELEFEITNHRKTLSQLQQAEEKYRNLVEKVPAIVYVAESGAEGKWHYVSPQIEAILGYSVEEWMEDSSLWVSRIHPDDRAKAIALDLRVGRTGKPLIAEYRLLSRSGREVWFRDEGVVVLRTPGQPVLIQGVMLEISDRKEAEKALAASEQRLHTIVDTEPECVKVVDRYGTLLEMNPAGLAMIEVDNPAQVVGSSVISFIAPEFRDSFVEVTERAYKGETCRVQFAIVGLKGTRRWVESYVAPLRDERNQITSVLSITRDITEQRHSMQALQESVERLHLVTRATNDLIWDWNLITDELWWSEGVEKVLGYRENEFGKTAAESWIAKIHPDDRERVTTSVRNVIENGGQSWSGEYRFRRADGSYGYFLDRGFVIHNSAGRAVRMVGALIDISEQRKAQEALRASEEKYRKIFEESKDVIFIATPEGQFIDINPAGVELLGYDSKEELLRMNISYDLFYHAEDRTEYLQQLSTKRYLKDYDVTLKKKDGRKLFVQETSTVLRDENGKVTGIRGILRDVTQLRELQQQLLHSQKIEAIGQLAGGVAHDFNNILMAIGTYCELLLVTVDESNPARDYLLEMQKAFERGSSLTKQLLAFSRRQVLMPSTLLLSDIVNHMQGMLFRLIGENIELVITNPPNLSYIHADHSQIEQVILNLVINARDAMHGNGKLIIETENQLLDDEYATYHHGSKSGRYVMLAVSDTGQGMDEATKARIFEPFFTTKEQGKGTGLGLSMVYGIVKQSGGFIMVYSEQGRGTTFRVYLPAMDQMPSSIPIVVPPENTTAIEGETLLLVDDSDSAREALASYLRLKGYDVITARNGQEALDKSRKFTGQIHALISDVAMPQMSGIELEQMLLKERPHLKTLFLSGYSPEAVRVHGELKPEAKFVSKPSPMQHLLLEIRTLLNSP
jgi:two-component system, cell cycle sensor histidine kinase and response regulator CckA